MKITLICALISAVFVISGCSSGESFHRTGFDFSQIDKIAVVDVVGQVGSEAARNQIADFFTMELLRKGYSPIERAQVQSILKEQKFQASDVTSAEGAAMAGRILNVPTVLIINVPTFKDKISLTAKMIDVTDGSILWMGSGSGTTGRTLSTLFGAVAGAAAGATIAGEGNQTEGAIAGGVVGAIAGQALTPQIAVKMRDITKKICQSLPYRFNY